MRRTGRIEVRSLIPRRFRGQTNPPIPGSANPGRSSGLLRMPWMAGSAARWVGVLTAGFVVLAAGLATDTAFLVPGPLTTSHRFSEGCSTCHSTIAKGQFGWLRGLVHAASPQGDSTACLACHTIRSPRRKLENRTGVLPHGLSTVRLEETALLQKKRGNKNNTVPDDRTAVEQLQAWLNISGAAGPKQVYCATCHKEHKGTRADLTAMPDQRCQTCHQVRFDSFEANHPPFVNYPFRRRTRIIFDHARHFGTHFKETRSKRPDAKFIPETCASCHSTTKNKQHMSVKPFAETCSSCHLPQILGAERATGPKGLALLTLPGLDLDSLYARRAPIGQWPETSDAELTPLMQLLLAGTTRRPTLPASISRLDLQDLSKASDEEIGTVVSLVWEIKTLMHALTTSKASDILKRIGRATGGEVTRNQIARLLATMPRDVLVGAQREWLPDLQKEMLQRNQPNWEKTFRAKAAKTGSDESGAEESDAEDNKTVPGADKLVTDRAKGRWYVNVLGEIVQEGAESQEAIRAAKGELEDSAQPPSVEPASVEGATDDEILLDESAVPAIDAESWSEFGGWYRKDFAILYKPTGHADRFMQAWLDFSGARNRNGTGSGSSEPASSVFDLLSRKDAQGQCTKCHSIDATATGGRAVQWSPSSLGDKTRRFTRFVHEPHFSVLDDRGCLTCHKMNAPKDLKASYQATDPNKFLSNFKPVEKQLCATCHKSRAARQDCKLCHTYHVTPVQTPMTATRLPAATVK